MKRVYLGLLNSWKEVPEMVRICQKSGHITREILDPFQRGDNQVVCDKCNYIYDVDSSD